MLPEEKELIEEKFRGLHAVIEAWQNIQHLTDKNINEKLDTAIDLGKITNGRVNKLEKGFFSWFDTPFKVALFFALILFVEFVFRTESLWEFVKKLFSIL